MDSRVALIGIIVSDNQAVDRVNSLLHDCAAHIVGRMGLPYRDRDISIISVVIDAQQDVISALSGRLGAIKGIKVKVIYN